MEEPEMETEAVAFPPWVGILVAFAIGALVRLLRLPVPAPATIYGALMVLGLTGGYLLMGWLLSR
jgi:XapX domain-containing protein